MDHGGYQTLKGGLLITGAMCILAFIDNFFGLIAADAGLWQFHVVRTLMVLPMLALLARITGQRLWPRHPGRVALRGVVLATGLMIYFAGLGVLPVAQVAAGLFTSPIWILIFSTFLFGVRVGAIRVLAMAAGFGGVLLILQPDPAALSLFTFAPLLAGAFYALGMLATRAWCAAEETLALTASLFVMLGLMALVMLVWFTLIPVDATGQGAYFVTRGWTTPTGTFWTWTFIQAVGSLLAIGMITRAYQVGEASYITVFEYSFLVFAAAWAWILWREGTDMLALTGIAVIVFSGVVISLRGADAAPQLSGEEKN